MYSDWGFMRATLDLEIQLCATTLLDVDKNSHQLFKHSPNKIVGRLCVTKEAVGKSGCDVEPFSQPTNNANRKRRAYIFCSILFEFK